MFRFLFPLLLSCSLFADPHRILGIGTAAVDLLMHIDDPFFSTHVGGRKGDCTASTPEILDQIIAASHIQPKLFPGGSAPNVIRGLASLGEHCAFHGPIGNDSFGSHFIQNLKERGITPFLTPIPNHPTLNILCLVTPDGQRTFRVIDVETNCFVLQEEAFEKRDLVLFEAYLLRKCKWVELAFQKARASGAKISLDLSSYQIAEQFQSTLLHLISNYVDILFANEDEVFALTGLPPEEGCRYLQTLCPISVITLGPKGCLVGHDNEILSIPAFPAIPIDTTGAGDLFASGFLYGYLNHLPLSICAQMGNKLGSAIVEIDGATLPPEKWEQLLPFFQQHLKER